MSPVKIHIMTSYGGIIRIRSRVEVWLLPLSPPHELPLCFVFRRVLYTRRGKKARTSFSFAFLPNRFYNFPDYVILVPNFAAPGGAIPRFGALPGTKGD